MPRYAAFLRGVSPMNAKMPELKRAFEAAGFTEVKTLLSSGNVSFETRAASPSALERKCEDAMRKTLGKPFLTFIRPIDALRAMLESDPYSKFPLTPGAKRVVTFLRKAPAPLELPMALGGARILHLEGNELFTAYVAGDKTPVFMTLIERAVGKEQTTRTWQTIEKVSR